MRLRRIVGLFAVAGAAVALSGCVGGFGPLTARESVTETRSFEPGGRFTLENTNGQVEISTWNEPRVRIEADKAASSDTALQNLKIEISGEGHRVDVRTRMPHPAFLGGGGRVNYRITLPASATVEARTVNGTVEVRGVAGAIEAKTVNGSVEIKDAAGEVEASTVNGVVSADYRTAPVSGHHRFSTTNGGVDVTLPRDAGGRVEAHVVNGGIDCDFDLTGSQRSRRRLEGRLGPGDAQFELGTVNGGVRLGRGLASAKAEPPARVPAEAPAK
jgi:DUF4097 and DUF4098 domain-containing protein YvlB